MKIAIISDLHIGDTNCVLVYKEKKNGKEVVTIGDKFNEFIDVIKGKVGDKPLDFLILLGDVLDFSITSYSNAYALGKVFFQELKNRGIAEQIIYVPGNHDYDLWNTVQYQINVINQFDGKGVPIPFRYSIPAIIDDREGKPTKGFTLHRVTAHKEKNKHKYGGLFLDKITEPDTHFNFAYPNVYLVTDEQTILITHGQYLEAYWSVLGKYGLQVMYDDLILKHKDKMDLCEMVAINSPLSVIGCSAIGQAGPLTHVIQELEHQLKKQDTSWVQKYLTRTSKIIIDHSHGISKCIRRFLCKFGIKEILKSLSNVETGHYNVEFYTDTRVQQRFRDYYEETLLELKDIETEYNVAIPIPESMIFGHTHQPIPWGSASAPRIQLSQMPGGKEFVMYNTGGWLYEESSEKGRHFCGAEIFFYETGKGITSVGLGQR